MRWMIVALLMIGCSATAANAQCIHYEQLPNVGVGQQSLPACDERGRIIMAPRVERPPPPDRPPPTRPSVTAVFDCKSFATSGDCGVGGLIQGSGPFKVVGTTSGTQPAIVNGQVDLINAGANHAALSLIYPAQQVSTKAFKSTFMFVPNGWNVAFTLNNSTNNPWGFNGPNFSAGAGCEAGFFQAFSQPAPPDRVFALLLDSQAPLTEHGAFTHSSVQYYDTEHHADNAPQPPGQSPCNPDLGSDMDGFHYASVTKISTAPVDLTSGGPLTTTGHTYSATLIYDGSNLFFALYDVTNGDTCPGDKCFTHSWANVDIPFIAGGDTAWLALTSGSNQPVSKPLLISAFNFYGP